MKIRMLAFVIMFAGLAVAQNPPTDAEKQILSFARTATTIAANAQSRSLNGYLAVYVDNKGWAAMSKDNDLGPFLKLKEAKADRRMLLLIAADGIGLKVAVYFEGESPAEMLIVPAGSKFDPAALQPVPKEALKELSQDLDFTKRDDVNTDDGAPVTAYQVSLSEKKPKS